MEAEEDEVGGVPSLPEPSQVDQQAAATLLSSAPISDTNTTVTVSQDSSDDLFGTAMGLQELNQSDDDSFHSLHSDQHLHEEVHSDQELLSGSSTSDNNMAHSDEGSVASGDSVADSADDDTDEEPMIVDVAADLAVAHQEEDMAQIIIEYLGDEEIPISDSSSDEEEEEDPSSRIITFDQSTPSAHTYLGSDMEDVHGRTLFEEDSVHILPAYMGSKVVLMPGQTMPLSLHIPSEIAMMRTAMDEHKTLAILHYLPQHRGNTFGARAAASIGTTAEVLSIGTVNTGNIPKYKVITRGRQRFTVLGINQLHGTLSASIKILPETVLGEPLQSVVPPSHYRPRAKHKSKAKFDNQGTRTAEVSPRKQIRKHNQCAIFTAWPDWVHSQYSPKALMQTLKQEIRKWGDRTYSIVNKINCPDQMAYWLADNIPITHSHKLDILTLQSSIQRLRYELHLIQKYKSLVCRQCDTLIAKRSDIFSLSFEGPMGTFVNPHGCVHETLTIRKAKHLNLRGRPQTEFSWYPGYAWTIVNCRECGSHKGWRFTSASLQPPVFYGLTRTGLNLVIDRDSRESEEIAPHTFVF